MLERPSSGNKKLFGLCSDHPKIFKKWDLCVVKAIVVKRTWEDRFRMIFYVFISIFEPRLADLAVAYDTYETPHVLKIWKQYVDVENIAIGLLMVSWLTWRGPRSTTRVHSTTRYLIKVHHRAFSTLCQKVGFFNFQNSENWKKCFPIWFFS